MWNCTHFRHPTDEQMGHVDIFFSNYCNLQSVYFELRSMNGSKGQQAHFIAVKTRQLTKLSGLVIYIYLKDRSFTVKRGAARGMTRCVKGAPVVNRTYTKLIPLLYIKGLELGE